MDKSKLAKYATAAAVTTGMAATLPVIAPFAAPFVVPLMASVFSEDTVKELGKKGVDTIGGILGNIASSAIWESPNPLEKSENQDLLRLLANAYLEALKQFDHENDKELKKQVGQILPLVEKRLKRAIDTGRENDLLMLFPLNKDSGKEDLKYSFANRISSGDLILEMADESFSENEILADEIEISIRRWYNEQKTAEKEKETRLTGMGLAENETLPDTLRSALREQLSKSIPKKIGELIKTEGVEKSWISFQRLHLQSILKEIKNQQNGLSKADRELFAPLAEKLDKLAVDSDLPEKLAKSTETILSRLDESEENVKQCIKEEKAKLQDYLAAMESRIRGDIHVAKTELRSDIHVVKTELVEEFHKISYERPLPNSIPASIGFVGRKEFLQEIHEKYQNGSRIFVFHGIGGVGKTALALKFAAEIEDEYEAKVFVDMQGLTNPLSARDAKFAIIKQFDPEVRADISDAELHTEYKSKVQNQPTLIVLDNAPDKQSIESLKEAKACLIITSRETFNLTGAINKHIGQMSREDARNLLFSIAGEERYEGQADILAEMAGYLPMALKPLSSILAEDELETIEDLIERYSDKKKLFAESVPDYKDLTVESSFELSYEALSDEMKERWRRLSVFPADFDEKAMAAVLNVSDSEVRETQKYLRKYSLLEIFSEKPPRFNFHDLAREFCDTKLGVDERFNIQFSFAEYYALVLLEAQNIQQSDLESGFIKSLQLIDMEWSNIWVGQRWSAENFEKNNLVAEFCLGYSIIFPKIILRLPPVDFIDWMETGLNVCQKYGYRKEESICLSNLGVIYERLNNYKKAVDHHTQALKIVKKIGELHLEAVFLNNIGAVHKNLGNRNQAFKFFGQALEILKEMNKRSPELVYLAPLLINMGSIQEDLSEYQKAIGEYNKALEISKEKNDLYTEGVVLNNLGNAHLYLGKIEKASNYFNQALKISENIGDLYTKTKTLTGLGTTYRIQNKNNKAIDYHNQALEISRQLDDRLTESICLNNLGTVFFDQGKKEKARDFWNESLTILEEIESPDAEKVRSWLKNIDKPESSKTKKIALSVVLIIFGYIIGNGIYQLTRWLFF